MAQCEHCGHSIPSENLTVHTAACQSGRVRQHHRRMPTSSESATRTTSRNPSLVLEQADPEGGIETIVAATTAPLRTPVLTSTRPPANDNDNTATTMEASSTTPLLAADNTHRSQQEWSCPRCTLINENTISHCEACGFHQQHQQSHNTNISPSSQHQRNQSQNDNTTAGMQVQVREIDPWVVNTALTTSNVLWWGAMGALVAGPVGAAVGGTAGVLMSCFQLSQSRNSPNQRPRVITMVSSRNGIPTTTTFTNATDGGRWRAVTMQAPANTSSLDGVYRRGAMMTPEMIDELFRQMLISQAVSRGETITNLEQMSYEELLERFGSGTDRRGASPETINKLPSTVLKDEADIAALAEHQKVCNICLEDFQPKDEMRKLPSCKHAFHKQCIDQWLARVASCPICKHGICQDVSAPGPATDTAVEQQQQHASRVS